jgi:hypothetical protein
VRPVPLRSRVGSLAVAVAVASVVSLSEEAPARAQQDALTATPSRRIVEVFVAGAGSDAASLDDTVRELLGRLTLVVESQEISRIDPDAAAFRSTSRPSLLARVGIDLRSTDEAVVTVVDGRTGEITVRRTVRREGSPAVVREELAHVVQAGIDPMVLLERDRANAAALAPEAPPPAPSPPAPAPPPPAPALTALAPPPRDVASPEPEGARAPLALDLATNAGAGSYASGAGLVPRAGGAASLVYRRGVRPFLGLSAHYVFPFQTGPEVARAHVGVTSLRAAGGLEIYGTSSFAVDLAGGAGVDVLRVEPRSNVLPSDRLADPTSRASPVVFAAIAGHLPIGAGTSLTLALAADVDLSSRSWVIETDGGQRTDAFAPSRVRPLALLGFTFTALGDTRFASSKAAR